MALEGQIIVVVFAVLVMSARIAVAIYHAHVDGRIAARRALEEQLAHRRPVPDGT